jgi:hypothetical protein
MILAQGVHKTKAAGATNKLKPAKPKQGRKKPEQNSKGTKQKNARYKERKQNSRHGGPIHRENQNLSKQSNGSACHS